MQATADFKCTSNQFWNCMYKEEGVIIDRAAEINLTFKFRKIIDKLMNIMANGFIQNKTHRSAFGVIGKQYDRTMKIIVVQERLRNQ